MDTWPASMASSMALFSISSTGSPLAGASPAAAFSSSAAAFICSMTSSLYSAVCLPRTKSTMRCTSSSETKQPCTRVGLPAPCGA